MKYQFCPICGEKYDNDNCICNNCKYVMYRNSVPAVGAIIIGSDKKILMVKRAIAPYKGKWEFVGGFLEYGEDPKDALKREIKEELHISVEIGELLLCVTDIYGENGKATLNLFYLVYLEKDVNLQMYDEIADYGWFAINKIPQEIAFNCTYKALEYIKRNKFI